MRNSWSSQVLLVVLQLYMCGGSASPSAADQKFDCLFAFDNDLHAISCKIALYQSQRSFYFDTRRIYMSPGDLCSAGQILAEAPLEVRRNPGDFLVAVRRGSCSFLTKNKAATLAGLAGIIIVNSEEGSFPFGESSVPATSPPLVPAVMVDPLFLAAANRRCGKLGGNDPCILHNFVLSYGKILFLLFRLNKRALALIFKLLSLCCHNCSEL